MENEPNKSKKKKPIKTPKMKCKTQNQIQKQNCTHKQKSNTLKILKQLRQKNIRKNNIKIPEIIDKKFLEKHRDMQKKTQSENKSRKFLVVKKKSRPAKKRHTSKKMSESGFYNKFYLTIEISPPEPSEEISNMRCMPM